ncbi:MAG TPA: hypothetical protein VN436_15460, partial [Holophaga sp.]|nr:hypothetical protein [Holophaga sp.]
ETEPRFWPRVWSMFQTLFKGPMDLVDRVPATSGLGAPWRFQVVMWNIPISLLLLVFIAMSTMASVAAKVHLQGNDLLRLLTIFCLVDLVLSLLLFVHMVFVGCLNHGALWLWGGMKHGRGMVNTIRLTGYFMGFFMLVGFIPIIGSLVALAGPAFMGLGMARIHRTDPWRGVCAAYTPFVAFVGLAFALLVFVL